MGRQREGEPAATRRLRLTDQAVVAVALAREHAAGRPVTGVDLLLGLAVETEGIAGQRLRAQGNALAELTGRAAALRPRSPAADVALRWADDEVAHRRPLHTVDVLDATLEIGGADLGDLLEACGLDRATLVVWPGGAVPVAADLVETYGFDPSGHPDLEPLAARALARARAVDGGAVALLVALSSHADEAGPADLRADALAARIDTLGDEATRTDSAWDAGLDEVLRTARVLRLAAEPLSWLDLVRACAVGGGRGPALLLAPRH